jgi:hypothetical protein
MGAKETGGNARIPQLGVTTNYNVLHCAPRYGVTFPWAAMRGVRCSGTVPMNQYRINEKNMQALRPGRRVRGGFWRDTVGKS